MKKYLLSILFVLFSLPAYAEISAFVSITSDNPLGTNLRPPGDMPRPGVELYVFDPTGGAWPGTVTPPYNTTYEITYKVTEQPASIVAIPGEILSTTYTENDSGDSNFPHSLVITFTHEEYAGGIAQQQLPGPISDFAIALIPAETDGSGPPPEMVGSWMSTNISPMNWQLIPPSETNPSFGYSLSGPAGTTAFFDMFVPQTLMDAMSLLYGTTITAADLAVFNNNDQVSVNSRSVPGGALIEIEVVFTATSNDVVDQETDVPPAYTTRTTKAATNVTKKLTVKKADDVSLTATKKKVKTGRRVSIYGWVRGGIAGERVKITSALAKASALAAGLRYKPLTAVLDSTGKFVKKVIISGNDSFRATFTRAGSPKKTSRAVRIKALP